MSDSRDKNISFSFFITFAVVCRKYKLCVSNGGEMESSVTLETVGLPVPLYGEMLGVRGSCRIEEETRWTDGRSNQGSLGPCWRDYSCRAWPQLARWLVPSSCWVSSTVQAEATVRFRFVRIANVFGTFLFFVFELKLLKTCNTKRLGFPESQSFENIQISPKNVSLD